MIKFLRFVWNEMNTAQKISVLITMSSVLIVWIWSFAKIVGWINTPLWLEVMPGYVNSFGIVSILSFIILLFYDNRYIKRDISMLRKEMRHGFQEHSRCMDRMGERMDRQFTEVHTNLHHLDKRVVVVETKLDAIHTNVDSLGRQITSIGTRRNDF